MGFDHVEKADLAGETPSVIKVVAERGKHQERGRPAVSTTTGLSLTSGRYRSSACRLARNQGCGGLVGSRDDCGTSGTSGA